MALAVAACGGGGGSTQAIVSPSPSPVACAAARIAAQTAAYLARPLHFTAALVPQRIGPGPSVRVCPTAGPGVARCFAWVRTDVARPLVSAAGYAPADLQAAYGLSTAAASNGTGQIVAVVDAHEDPKAEADLSVYRSTFGLPACTTANGCFLKVNQNGKKSPLPTTDSTGSWEAEESLDLDMVSAICPKCSIRLIETNSDNTNDLYAGEDTAATVCGATEISDSWGTNEYSTEHSDEAFFNHTGVVVTVAAGDAGFGVNFPATSSFVTSVGGTTLNHASASTWTQTVWSGTGSGCSQFIDQPSWQASLAVVSAGTCRKRVDNDVAIEADPNTGVAGYDTFGGSDPNASCSSWCVFGGTSASAPMVAGVYALAGNGASLNGASLAYSNTSSLTDIVSGNDGTCGGTYLCTAGPGFDGPTGLGSPVGTGAF